MEIGKILREICIRNRVEIIEANACPNHVHMLMVILQKMSVSKFMGIDILGAVYYVDTIGRKKTAIEKYIQNQLQ